MAKKAVAGFRDKTKAKAFTKVVVAVKNPDTGAYTFKEEIVPSEGVKEFLNNAK